MSNENNKVAIRAEENARLLFQLFDRFPNKKKGRFVSKAWENENSIKDAAINLQREIKDAKRILDEALACVMNNNTMSLNGYGILQSTNTNIDRFTTELKTLISARKFYLNQLLS